MKKVYQTIVEKGKGNCQQAVIASLFELDLEEVPHFIEYQEAWYDKMEEFVKSKGYPNLRCFQVVNSMDLNFKVLEQDGGINGYWSAAVKSQTFENTLHAVVIDKNMNVVHDPNPNQRALKLKPEDIVWIDLVGEGAWDIDSKGGILDENL